MTTTARTTPGKFRRFHERFIVDVRDLPHHVRRNLYVWAASLVLVGLVAFLIILVAVLQRDGVSAIDAPIERALDASRTGWLTTTMIVVAIAFGPTALPIIILVVVVMWSILAKHLWRPLLLAAGTLTGVIIVQLIAHAVQRHRPPVAQMLFGTDLTFSFPSGHVMGACNFLLLTTYLVFSRRQSPKAPAIAFTVAGILIFITALCRVYLGYHWATDALASVSLSLVILGTVIAIDTRRTVRATPSVDSQ